jgi:uncharacterized coiled-coil protein SlyX
MATSETSLKFWTALIALVTGLVTLLTALVRVPSLAPEWLREPLAEQSQLVEELRAQLADERQKVITAEQRVSALEEKLSQLRRPQGGIPTSSKAPTNEGRTEPGNSVLPPPDSRLIQWNRNATAEQSWLGQTFDFRCPPNGSLEVITGTDVYTAGSSICTSAVHAGLIQATAGGEVTIKILSDTKGFEGSMRNGVQSRRFVGERKAFEFAR